MFIHQGNVPMCVVTDYRTKHDSQLDDAEEGVHVLDAYRLGRDAVPCWSRVTRIALFEYDATPTATERKQARDQLSLYLSRHKFVTCAMIPNELQSLDKRGPTLCWTVFNAPDSSSEMRGTLFEYIPGQYVMPIHSRSKTAKQLHLWQQARFLQRAHRIAMGKESILTCQHKLMTPGRDMLWALEAMALSPVAVDIESIESTNIITAIGISDGEAAVSLPYDAFIAVGTDEPEPGWQGYGAVGKACRDAMAACLASKQSKYFHNHTFDVPRLQDEKLQINGIIHDTFAAHSIAFPELRHGLQHACADMLPCRPWKSAWHPKLRGITRDDEEYWSCDANALRDYNCDDAFHTWHLARTVLPCVGVKSEST